MRDSTQIATLNELMGNQTDTPKSMDDLPKLLGDKMPEIPTDRVGRVRLIHALQERFGNGFMNMPGVKNIIADFDKRMLIGDTIKMNRRK